MPLATRRRVAGARSFFSTKDAFAWDRPVNALGSGAPLLLALNGVLGVGWLWPHDGLAIAAGNHKQAFPAGGGSEVAGLDYAPFDGIAQALQLGYKHRPGLTSALGVWYQKLLADRHHFTWLSNHATQLDDAPSRFAALGYKRPPLQDLLHVLSADYPGALHACPLKADPRQVTNLTFAGLPTGGLAVVGAVR